MEIRGLGIINIESLFGVGAIRDKKRIELVVRLEEWDAKKEYDRLGLTPSTLKIFDVEIPTFVIPVRPGRNLAVIIEVAAMNHRLMKLGYFTAQEFADRVTRIMAEESAHQQQKGRPKGCQLFAPAIHAHNRVEIASVMGVLRIILRNPAHGNVEGIDLVVVGTILQRDGEIPFCRSEVTLSHVIDRELFVIPRLSIAADHDQIAQERELLPQG